MRVAMTGSTPRLEDAATPPHASKEPVAAPPSPPLSRQHERSDRCLRALRDARDNDITAEDVNTESFVE
jgi:hypothetical protein